MVFTTRPSEGTRILYPPGEVTLLPRLSPTQALGSIVVLENMPCGFTANARQPNGMMFNTFGFLPGYQFSRVTAPTSPDRHGDSQTVSVKDLFMAKRLGLVNHPPLPLTVN